MKNLSELPNDTLLYIDRNRHDPEIITKEDFCNELEIWKKLCITVYIAKPYHKTFNLYECIERMSDDMYGDWITDVLYGLESVGIGIIAIEEMINAVLKEYPTYNPSEQVIID